MRHWLPVAGMEMPSPPRAGRRGKQTGTGPFSAQPDCPVTEWAEMRAENRAMASSTTGRTKCHRKCQSTFSSRPLCQHDA